MKKLSLYTILIACLMGRSFSVSAQQHIRLQFVDSATAKALNAVTVIDAEGIELASSDNNGYITTAIPLKYLIAVRKGYKPDTIRNTESAVIYMKPLSVTLDDVIVNNKKVRRILHSAVEYVVDYDFIDDNILVVSYSGNNGKNAKIFLLDNAGDTLALTKFPDQPLALFKSCTGHQYCVCHDKMYPISVDAGAISIGAPWDVALLPLLRQCEQSIGNTLYYHYLDKDAFRSIYSYRQAYDTVSRPFYNIEQYSDARGNAEELQEILAMLQFGNFRGAMRLNGMRKMRNDIAYRSLGLPIFRVSDSLVIFDFNRMRINHFDPRGMVLKQTKIAFDPGGLFRVDILQDRGTDRFYILNSASQKLQQLNISTGKKSTDEILLKRPFAEKVKVHKGNIYYLWQDEKNYSTRQLFVQSPF